MSYLTLTFAVFVIILLIIYYLVPKNTRGLILLCGSLFFYGCFDLKYFVFLFFVSLTTFWAAKLLVKSERKKIIVFGCIAANVSVWFIIKELTWTTYTIIRFLNIFDLEITAPIWNILVPVGISYYMLQAISYISDVYMGKQKPENCLWRYLLFLSYFPAIVQGPISRYSQLMPQLLNKKKFSYENMRNGLLLILFGLVKKMVLADRLGIFVDYCFGNYADLRGVTLYVGAIFYSIQLYADFSGCVDICRGVSKLFGIELMHNFSRPYMSGSIKEFWGRWHMSLSGWLKDYVYIPLGGNRRGISRKYINLLITFMVSGIWHGAGFNFIFWGLLHAVYQIIENATMSIRYKIKNLSGLRWGLPVKKSIKLSLHFIW